MTIGVVIFFFLVSLISSNTAVTPPGIKVRIMENAKGVLKDLGLTYLQGLVNREFSIEDKDSPIKSVKLTKLQVDPHQMDVRFQENIGLQFEIKDLNFALEVQRGQISFIGEGETIFTGEGVSATIPVRMKQNQQRHLDVELQKCKFTTDKIKPQSTGKRRKILDLFIRVSKKLFKHKICPKLQPILNDKLKALHEIRIHEDRQLDLDFSLSNTAVTSSSFDISFKGLLSVRGQAVNTGSIRAGREPVFTETNQMIYVGFSEFIFNGAGMAIYKSGPFKLDTDTLHNRLAQMIKNRLLRFTVSATWNTGWRIMGITPGPFTVKLTEAPIFQISNAGLSVKINIGIQSQGQQSLLMTCQDTINVELKERHLIPVFQNLHCENNAGTIISQFRTRVVNFGLYIITKFLTEIPIPLPTELSITDAKTQYEQGYLVAGGRLTFNPQSSSNVNR